MKTKNYLIGILVFIIAALILNTVEGWFTFSEKDKLADESKIEKPKLPDVNYYTNAIDSTLHAALEETKGIDPKNYITNKYYSYVSDTLAPALKISMQEVKDLKKINAKLEGQLKASKIDISPEKKKTYTFSSKYLNATANEADSTLNYSYNAEIHLLKYEKRSSWLGSKKTYIDISSPDKNFKINGVESFTKDISDPPTKIGIGVQAGYGVNANFKISPYIGVGVSYNLIRF